MPIAAAEASQQIAQQRISARDIGIERNPAMAEGVMGVRGDEIAGLELDGSHCLVRLVAWVVVGLQVDISGGDVDFAVA